MATYTNNINLLKPAETEKYDVNLRNDNWDKIDKAIGDADDALKKHKEHSPIDHPDGSVTTPKLRDKCVTPAKLSEELNLKLKNDFVKRSGDTMQGNLTLNNSSIGFNNGTGIYDTKIRIASNGNFDIGVTEDRDNKNATNQLLLHSQNKPKWYNSANGGKVLATEEYVDTEANKRVKKAGDTMTGDLNLSNNAKISIERKAGGGTHTISDGGVTGGQTNLDIGNKNFTPQANLCCYNRPGWYGKDKMNTFKPFLFDDDMVITSGTIAHDQLLPIPEGFREDECHWLLTVAESTSNLGEQNGRIYVESGSFGVNVICKREGRKVKVGTYYHTGSGNTDYHRGNWFLPGTANYVCICRRRF